MTKYEPVIGLEIHAELKTKSKMFCSCKNPASPSASQGGETFEIGHQRSAVSNQPNTNVCPVCLGMPGTLPVLNKQAIEWTVMTGLATNCQISGFTKWDRKNYFYPDLPKGYQISQFDLPICKEGQIEISNFQFPISKETPNPKNQTKKIRITRIHLEEDTGTSKHPEGREGVDYSLLDYNRAGVPLMELVTEPDIKSAEDAKEFCKSYQLILRNLGVASADMEKGQMRCEANISIMPVGTKEFGTKVEVKNLNSFKAVERAIKYEIERQTELLKNGEKIVQETRGWDDAKGKTYTMRIKETSADYRYFPEPDLPPVTLSKAYIEDIKRMMPESLEDKKNRYMTEYKLPESNAVRISSDLKIADYFDKSVMSTSYATDLANLLLNSREIMDIKPEDTAMINNLIRDKKISKNNALDMIPGIKSGKKIPDIIKEKGLDQISDSADLELIIKKVIDKNPDAVDKIKSGQKGVAGFLVGQIMRETKGQADPKTVNEIINKLLS